MNTHRPLPVLTPTCALAQTNARGIQPLTEPSPLQDCCVTFPNQLLPQDTFTGTVSECRQLVPQQCRDCATSNADDQSKRRMTSAVQTLVSQLAIVSELSFALHSIAHTSSAQEQRIRQAQTSTCKPHSCLPWWHVSNIRCNCWVLYVEQCYDQRATLIYAGGILKPSAPAMAGL